MSVPRNMPFIVYIFVLASAEAVLMLVVPLGLEKVKLIVPSMLSVMSVIGLPMNFLPFLLALKSLADGILVSVSDLLFVVPG